ncbi:hypothetical protein AKJ16_DCAP12118 [Drosera capensis]
MVLACCVVSALIENDWFYQIELRELKYLIIERGIAILIKSSRYVFVMGNEGRMRQSINLDDPLGRKGNLYLVGSMDAHLLDKNYGKVIT